jgi:hypothetical protein
MSAATLDAAPRVHAAAPVPAADWGRPAADSARARLVLALVALVSLAVGGAGLALGEGTLRWTGLLVFCAVGIGSAPWQLAAGLGLTTRLLLTGVTTLAAWTLPATAMVFTGWWQPMPVFALLAAVAAPLHLSALYRARRDLRSAADGTPAEAAEPASRRPLVLAGVGGLLCAGAAVLTRPIDPGFWGFLTEVGPVWYAGLALVLVAVVLSLGKRERETAIVVLVLVAVLTLTPSLVYEGPRSQSAFKHIDLIAQIREGGGLTSSVSVYDSWPGFFAALAWLYDVTGIRDMGYLATFWPPLLALFRLVALRALAGRLLASAGQRWTAVVLAVLVDSIGADYFSPQSVGFVLGVAVFALALSPGLGRTRVVMLLAAGCTIAVSHQLSPYIVSGVLVVLAVSGLLRPWWLLLLVAGPAVGWTVLQLPSVLGFLDLDSLGQLTNFRPPPLETAPGLSRLPVVTATVVALVVGVVVLCVLAVVAFLRSWRDRRSWGLILAPAVGLALIVINPYGQEGIFRAVLFAVPWLAVLAARCFPDRPVGGARLAVLATTAVLSCSFLVASFGLDGVNVVRPGDVAAVTHAQQQGGDDYQLLYLGAGDLPDTLRRGPVLLNREIIEVPVEHLPGVSGEEQAARLTAAYADYWAPSVGGPATMYAIWSPVSGRYADAYGLQRPDQFEQLRDALLASPYWRVELASEGTLLLELDIARYEADRASGAA